MKYKAPPTRLKNGRFPKGFISPNRNGVWRECLMCKSKFYISASRIRTKRGAFCSQKCWQLYRRGKRYSRSSEFKVTTGNTSEYMKLREKYRHQWKEWRTKVFKRDNHTCQDCKRRGGYLNAHHIFPFMKFPKLRFEIDNGVTLCRKCHAKREYGIKKDKFHGRIK